MTRPTTGAVKSWLSVASGYVSESDEEDEHLRQEAIRRVEAHDRLVAALRDIIIICGRENLCGDIVNVAMQALSPIDDADDDALLAEIGGDE